MPENREAKNLIERLPDTYTKKPGSRLFRLFRIVGAEISELRSTLQNTQQSRDVDQATGASLENIGWHNLRVARESATDAGYLLRIKARIAQHRADGTIDTIIEGLAFALNRKPEEIGIVSPGHASMDEPASLLVSIPFELLPESTLSGPEIQALIENMVAAGISTHIVFGIHGGVVQAAAWPKSGVGRYVYTGHLYSKPIAEPTTSGHLKTAALRMVNQERLGVAPWRFSGAFYSGEVI